MYAQPETDDDEARAQAAIIVRDRLLLRELRGAAPPGSYEHAFMRRDPATFDGADRALLERLAWHYRRRLTAAFRPHVNPDDPIIREARNHG